MCDITSVMKCKKKEYNELASVEGSEWNSPKVEFCVMRFMSELKFDCKGILVKQDLKSWVTRWKSYRSICE